MKKRELIKLAGEMALFIDAEKVILYGSHSKKKADLHSDIVLVFIAETDLPRYKRSRILYQKFKTRNVSMEFHVYTPREAKDAAKSKSSFLASALKNGEIVYKNKSLFSG